MFTIDDGLLECIKTDLRNGSKLYYTLMPSFNVISNSKFTSCAITNDDEIAALHYPGWCSLRANDVLLINSLSSEVWSVACEKFYLI